MCLALKNEVEVNPEWVNVDKIIIEAYQNLVGLLGPHDRSGITLHNIRNRIIFTDPETITSFRYLYEQPGEDSDKYWENPIKRIATTRDVGIATSIYNTTAITYDKLGMIMIPNNKAALDDIEDIHRQYIEKQGFHRSEYPELKLKRIVAHELVHYLYTESLKAHFSLCEPIADYIATLVFPEIQGTSVQLAWAKASINEYLKRLKYHSIYDLTHPIEIMPGQKNEHLSDVATKIKQKYFSEMNYEEMGLPEFILNKVGKSKFSPIPD